MPAKRVGEGAGDGDRRVGEGGRGGEPVGGGDVEADQPGDRVGAEAQAGEDGEDEAEGGDRLGEPLAGAGAHRRAETCEIGSSNMACASSVPATPPAICAAT